MIGALLRQQLEERKRQGLYRSRHLPLAHHLNFSSNDYLSLRGDPRVKRAYQEGFARHDAGSGASMVVGGYQSIHHELEQRIATDLGVDKALLFSSGYAANLGIILMLASLDCHFLIDKAVHASIYDGLKLAQADFSRYRHNDYFDLQRRIANKPVRQVLLSEGIFSMSGQQPDLQHLAQVCATQTTPCIIDESHAFGVMGPHGLGAVAHYGLTAEQVPLRMIAFGKAMGGQAAVVAGQSDWVDALYQSARSWIYSTAISPALTYGLLASYELLHDADEARHKLHGLIRYFQEAVAQSPLSWRHSDTAIQQLRLACPHKALAAEAMLREQGVLCQAMRQPTVLRMDTGLRVVLNAHHTTENIDHLFTLLHNGMAL